MDNITRLSKRVKDLIAACERNDVYTTYTVGDVDDIVESSSTPEADLNRVAAALHELLYAPPRK